MIHIQFFYYILVLLIGWSSVSGAWLAWRDSRKKGALSFTLVLGGLWLIQLELVFQLYGNILVVKPVPLEWLQQIADSLALILLMGALPSLANHSLGRELGKAEKGVTAGGILTVLILKAAYGLTDFRLFVYLGIGILYMYLFWTFALFWRMRGDIGSPELRRYLRSLGILSVCFLPLLLLEHFRSLIPLLEGQDWVETFALPTFFLGLNLLSFLYGRPFYRHGSEIERGELLESFCTRYGLTKREKEITERYSLGKTFVQVGEELFISPKTVDKHVENIYARTGVKSQAQLIHLVSGGI